MNEPGWQDPLMVTLGVSMFAIQWLLPSTFGDPIAGDRLAWALILTGIAMSLIAVGGILLPGRWEALIEFALGIWMMVLPWVGDPYVDPVAATWIIVIAGAITTIVSGVSAFFPAPPRRKQE
ncbi:MULTISPECIES: hypothetical protein [unclassified Rhizobium]|uniref:SPW repeat domain-containing protein n=1 Tax=unclassified Rhizobium TaxID=2613769 RepID=UPI001610B3B4|nr:MULTISPECIES: hypothetical protein [unclassified Rhizobium]MBB3545179.1 hypothetical protein [Rhizobium sp. BK399]MCS3743592.1 hypothetical protein [Rhizobium sp. BK661]MCS4096521.1 hypothetical protein [Rhizobium sp. BK176]